MSQENKKGPFKFRAGAGKKNGPGPGVRWALVLTALPGLIDTWGSGERAWGRFLVVTKELFVAAIQTGAVAFDLLRLARVGWRHVRNLRLETGFFLATFLLGDLLLRLGDLPVLESAVVETIHKRVPFVNMQQKWENVQST